MIRNAPPYEEICEPMRRLRLEAGDPLAKYKQKRKFDETPEPEGGDEKGGNKHRFVIQRHRAKRAGEHFDLRLENDDGTMSSWSIPKHRLPRGKEKLLAVKTEDHPLEYRTFEGTIPEGEYGAGEMEIHDSGTYDEIEWGKTKIVFRLKGKKEKGAYKLFRTHGSSWMIMAAKDGDLKKATAAERPLSKRAMEISEDMIPTLWYENEAGDRHIPEDGVGVEGAPEGFIYQHSQFPLELHHTILRGILKDEVEECGHPEEDVRKTYGWVDGIEGRECARCGGRQTRKTDEKWPAKWDADGCKTLLTGSSSWPEDLVMAMASSGDWPLRQAILIAANSCERCMNALAHKYGLEWGYPEFGDEWKEARTSCAFCTEEGDS